MAIADPTSPGMSRRRQLVLRVLLVLLVGHLILIIASFFPPLDWVRAIGPEDIPDGPRFGCVAGNWWYLDFRLVAGIDPLLRERPLPGVMYSFQGGEFFEVWISCLWTLIPSALLTLIVAWPWVKSIPRRWREARARLREQRQLRRERRHEHRLRHCRVCGYDCRASPTRCPECGADRTVRECAST
jgi:hypothetical protein